MFQMTSTSTSESEVVNDAALQADAMPARAVKLRMCCTPSSQYCWWKLPKPHGGQVPGRSPGSTRTSGLSTRNRLNCRRVTYTTVQVIQPRAKQTKRGLLTMIFMLQNF